MRLLSIISITGGIIVAASLVFGRAGVPSSSIVDNLDSYRLPDSLPATHHNGLFSSSVDSLNMRMTGFHGISPNSYWISRQDDYLYMSAGGGLVVFDLSIDSMNPTDAGCISDFPVAVYNSVPNGNYLYVTRWNAGLYTYDISNPTAPKLLDNWAVSGDVNLAGYVCIINGALCFIAIDQISSRLLVVCSLGDPAHPQEIARLELPQSEWGFGYDYHVDEEGNRLIASDRGSCGITVIDLNDPADPQITADVTLVPGRYLWHFTCDDGEQRLYANLCNGGESWLFSFDVEDYSAPVLLDSFYISDQGLSLISWFGKDTLLGMTQGSFEVPSFLFDVSDPINMGTVSTFSYTGFVSSCVSRNKLWYFSDDFNGLFVYDFSDIENIDSIWNFMPGAWWYNTALPLGNGDCYFFGDGKGSGIYYSSPTSQGGLSHPTQPVVVGWLYFGYDALLKDNLLVFNSHAYLRCYDISQPAAPQFLGEVFAGVDGCSIFRLFRTGNYVFTANGAIGTGADPVRGGITVSDISDPHSPVLLDTFPLEKRCYSICVNGDVIYVTGAYDANPWAGHLEILTFDGSKIHFVDSTRFSNGRGLDLCLYNGYLYLAREIGLDIYDVSEPLNPILVGSTSDLLGYNSGDVEVVEDRAFVASYDGLVAYDVSDPSNPRTVGYYIFSFPREPDWTPNPRLKVDWPYLYWCWGGGGVLVFKAYGEASAIGEEEPVSFNPVEIELFVKRTVSNGFVLSYSIPYPSAIDLSIYDPTGRKVTTLYQGQVSIGSHELTWDASDVPAGVYFVRLSAAGKACTKRLLILK